MHGDEACLSVAQPVKEFGGQVPERGLERGTTPVVFPCMPGDAMSSAVQR